MQEPFSDFVHQVDKSKLTERKAGKTSRTIVQGDRNGIVVNSPWNIAADFNVDMSFSKEEIEGMLREYEKDHHTGMDVGEISGLLYDYHQKKGYMLSFNFNKNKKIGVQEIIIEDKLLIEAVV